MIPTLLLIGAALIPILLAFRPFGADRYLRARATIADTLGEFMKDIHLNKKTTISIVGGRCANIDDDNYPWIERLKAWLNEGVTINYLLIEATEQSKERLALLGSEFSNRLKTFYIDDVEAISDSETKRLVKESRTTHFILFTDPKLIWLEGNHPTGSKEAYDCEFVNTKRALRDNRFTSLEDLFARFCKEAQSQPVAVN